MRTKMRGCKNLPGKVVQTSMAKAGLGLTFAGYRGPWIVLSLTHGCSWWWSPWPTTSTAVNRGYEALPLIDWWSTPRASHFVVVATGPFFIWNLQKDMLIKLVSIFPGWKIKKTYGNNNPGWWFIGGSEYYCWWCFRTSLAVFRVFWCNNNHPTQAIYCRHVANLVSAKHPDQKLIPTPQISTVACAITMPYPHKKTQPHRMGGS